MCSLIGPRGPKPLWSQERDYTLTPSSLLPQPARLRPGVRWKARNLKQAARRGRGKESASVLHSGLLMRSKRALCPRPNGCLLCLGSDRGRRMGWNRSPSASRLLKGGAFSCSFLFCFRSAEKRGWKRGIKRVLASDRQLSLSHRWEDAERQDIPRRPIAADFCRLWLWHHFLFPSPHKDGRMLKENNKRKQSNKQ